MAAGLTLCGILVLLVVAARRQERARRGAYVDQLDAEATKYLPKKASVRIYSEIKNVLKANPELGSMPIRDVVEGFERFGERSMRKGAAELTARGVKLGKVRKAVVHVGRKGTYKTIVEMLSEMAKGSYEPDEKEITIRIPQGMASGDVIFTHEITHAIIDHSPLGQYGRNLLKFSEKAEKGSPREKHAHQELDNFIAINEALAYAVQDSIYGTKRDIELVEGVPSSKYYDPIMAIIKEKGVKTAVEAVAKINPLLTKRHPDKYYESFEQMIEKLTPSSAPAPR